MSDNNNGSGFIFGLFMGTIAGAIAGAMLSPKSGEELRSLLDAKRKDAQARLKSSERPKDVLITYRKLISDASKDQFTLDKLEDDYRLLLLEK